MLKGQRHQLEGAPNSQIWDNRNNKTAECRIPEKAFLNEQRKETEENNGIGKTSDLSKKIGDTKGTFHAKIGTVKDRNSKDLTEAEEIKKR